MISLIPGSNVVIIESTEFFAFSAIFVMNSLFEIQSKKVFPIESDRGFGEGLDVSFRFTLIVASIGADGKVCGILSGITASICFAFSILLFESMDSCFSQLSASDGGLTSRQKTIV